VSDSTLTSRINAARTAVGDTGAEQQCDGKVFSQGGTKSTARSVTTTRRQYWDRRSIC